MIEREAVENELAHKYRQPRGVEQFGIEPIPEELKTVKWYDVFLIVVNFIINPAQILVAGLAVAAGLPFWGVVAAMVAGVAVVFVPYVVMATVGVDYGLPGLVSTRMAFGIRGAKWIASGGRLFSAVFWFAFQTIAGATAILAVLDVWSGVEVSLVAVSLVFAIVQAVVAVSGYGLLKTLSRVAFPLKIAILSYLGYVLVTHDAPGFAPSEALSYGGTVGWQWGLFAVWFASQLSAWINLTTDAADFCRYSRTRTDMWIGTLGAAVVGAAVASLFGAYGAAATRGEVPNTFEVVAGTGAGGLTLLLILVVVALDNWTINVMNLYTGGLGLSNAFPSVGRFWATLAVAAGGIVLSVFPQEVIGGFIGIASAVGTVFVPIASVLIVDYVFVKRTRIDVLALFDRNGPYWYTSGFNPVAVAWIATGAVIYYFVPQPLVPPLVAFVLVGIGYYVTVRILARRLPALDAAARPGRQYEDISVDRITAIT